MCFWINYLTWYSTWEMKVSPLLSWGDRLREVKGLAYDLKTRKWWKWDLNLRILTPNSKSLPLWYNLYKNFQGLPRPGLDALPPSGGSPSELQAESLRREASPGPLLTISLGKSLGARPFLVLSPCRIWSTLQTKHQPKPPGI